MREGKMLFLVATLNSGGIENYILRYINYDKDSDAYVLCKSGEGGQLEKKYFERLGFDNVVKIKIGYFNIISWCRLFRFIKKNNIITVCDFTGEVSGIPIYIAKVAGVKNRLVFYRHSRSSFSHNCSRYIYVKLMKFLINNYSTKILSNSQSALDFFHNGWQMCPLKYRVIYNGVDREFIDTSYFGQYIRQDLMIPVDAFVIGHTGRVDAAKNHNTILKVAQIVCRINPKVHFILAGNGTDFLTVDEFKDRIHLLGYRNDVGNLLAAMDLFYFPSITEGQPNSLIEAMVKNVPVIASDIEPIKETVPKRMISELLPPKDVQKAVEKILHAIGDHFFLQSLRCGDWAVEYYDSEKLFSQFKQELQ